MENQDIQEIENKKRSLKRYKKNIACIGRLEDKKTLLDLKRKSPKSPNYSGMPRGGTPITNEDISDEIIDLEKRIERLKAKGKRLKDEILEDIDSLEDPRYCEVLEAYFIDCKTIAEISEDMGYSERYIYDLYRDGISALTFSSVR